MDAKFPQKFIPNGEMAVIRAYPDVYEDAFEMVERQLRSLPASETLWGKNPEETRIYAHYFGGASDWWIYALEADWNMPKLSFA